jgi:hypothetical protein
MTTGIIRFWFFAACWNPKAHMAEALDALLRTQTIASAPSMARKISSCHSTVGDVLPI